MSYTKLLYGNSFGCDNLSNNKLNVLDCDKLESKMLYLKEKFEARKPLCSEDLDLLIDIIYSVNKCNKNDYLLSVDENNSFIRLEKNNEIISSIPLPALGLSTQDVNNIINFDFDNPQNFIYINTNNVPITQGGYEAGQPATPPEGLTQQQALDKLLFPPLEPTIDTFTAIPQPEYNQPTPYNINISWDVTINTVGATLDTLVLEWRRGTSGAFTQLTTDQQLSNFTHVINTVDNQDIQYKLTVTDSSGETQAQTITRTIQGYSAPSGSLSKTPSANTIERGANITVNGSVTRNRQYAIMNNIKFQKRVNNGAWTIVEQLASADLGASQAITQYLSNNGNNDNNVQFRILVTDTGNSNNNQIAFTETNLILPYFWGKTANNPTINQTLFNNANKEVKNSNGTLDIVYNASAEYLWFAIPVGSTPKTNWFVTALNAGNIGSPTDLFGSPVDFTVTSPDGLWTQDYKVYITNNPTSTINGQVMELRN